MLTRFTRKLACRLLSLLLAAMWGALILLGVAGTARCRTAAAAKPRPAPVQQCTMCHSLHPGGLARCCCHPKPTVQTVLCARCDQNDPGIATAIVWAPLAVLPDTSAFIVAPSGAEAFRPAPSWAATFRLYPPSRPPRLL